MGGYVELKAVAGALYAFDFRAEGHRIVLTSERHGSKKKALAAIAMARESAAIDARFHRKIAQDRSASFVLTAADGSTIGQGATYPSAGLMELDIAAIKLNLPRANTRDLAPAD